MGYKIDEIEGIGISESQLLKWTNMADLMRISGVGEEYSNLLEAAVQKWIDQAKGLEPLITH